LFGDLQVLYVPHFSPLVLFLTLLNTVFLWLGWYFFLSLPPPGSLPFWEKGSLHTVLREKGWGGDTPPFCVPDCVLFIRGAVSSGPHFPPPWTPRPVFGPIDGCWSLPNQRWVCLTFTAGAFCPKPQIFLFERFPGGFCGQWMDQFSIKRPDQANFRIAWVPLLACFFCNDFSHFWF